MQDERLPAPLYLTAHDPDPAAPVQVWKLQPARESVSGLLAANQ